MKIHLRIYRSNFTYSYRTREALKKEELKRTSRARRESPISDGRAALLASSKPDPPGGKRTWICSPSSAGMAAAAAHPTWSLAHEYLPFSASPGGGHLQNLQEEPFSVGAFNFLLSGKRRARFWGVTLLGVSSHPTAGTPKHGTSARGLKMLPGLSTTEQVRDTFRPESIQKKNLHKSSFKLLNPFSDFCSSQKNR